MAIIRTDGNAFGRPGLEPRWTHGGKDGVGTAYSASSRVWFTLWNGVITEVYYPTVDRPQIRDLQFLITDGATFFHEEKRHLLSHTESLDRDALAYRATNTDPHGRYALIKEIITDPHQPCVLQHVTLGGEEGLAGLQLYVLCAPHIEVGGMSNNAHVIEIAGRRLLAAEKRGTWLVLGATIPFARLSCGFVGASDGWTDLHQDLRMDWEFTSAADGNVALTGLLDRGAATELTIGLAFGPSLESAATCLCQALDPPFAEQLARYREQWRRPLARVKDMAAHTGDDGGLYRRSVALLLAHEDKSYPGALIASLSIPWGEAHGDDDQGGYHLVWTRDMANGAAALLAAGLTATPRRALAYLAVAQQADGGFPQNFWIDGSSYWQGIQLDEVAFPILLAWRMHAAGELQQFDPWPMVRAAAAFLVRHGPATQQERWEEAAGYSPSTLAASIAGLICAADLARVHQEPELARFLEEYADFLEGHVEDWTVTRAGTLLPGVSRHYIRIQPIDLDDPRPVEDLDGKLLHLANQAPGSNALFPARDIVDAGFLELVRYGIRKGGDALVEDSLRVVDHLLRVETPVGPVWRRYNHDGYGQRDDGRAFGTWGVGRAWPLLTGERAHYELAAGRDPIPYLRTMEKLASVTDLLTEQVWDGPDQPDIHMYRGRPTGAAMPLMWAHAEYLKLLRSIHDGAVFDRIPPVVARYQDARPAQRLEVWKLNRQPAVVARGTRLRIQAPGRFRLHWTRDEWQTVQDTDATDPGIGIGYVDLETTPGQTAPFRFTFFWTEEGRWEGKDYLVTVGD